MTDVCHCSARGCTHTDTMAFAGGICTECSTAGCRGTSTCSVGYSGTYCDICEPGFWMNVEEKPLTCYPCGQTESWVLGMVAIVLVILAVLVVKFNNSPALVALSAPLRNGFIYIQSTLLNGYLLSSFYFLRPPGQVIHMRYDVCMSGCAVYSRFITQTYKVAMAVPSSKGAGRYLCFSI